MEDYYKILGVDKNADKNEIKRAFRKLAHKYHPDKGGDEKRFKEVSEAYSVLSDEKKRQEYDQFGSGGAPSGNPFRGGFSSGGFQSNVNPEDLSDIFGDIFGFGRKRGSDVLVDLKISFKESIFGVKKRVHIPYRERKIQDVDITIPPNILDGQRLKMSGFGESIEGGDPGDLYVRIGVEADDNFSRSGNMIIYHLKIALTTAILGDKIEIKSIEGKKIKINIPEQTRTGDLLRVSVKNLIHFFIKVDIDRGVKLSKKAKGLLEDLKEEGL